MRAVVTRVKSARVEIDGRETAAVGAGYLVLLGVTDGDTPDDARIMARKICNLRVFGDDNGKMNLSLADINGELLIISNFTLYGSVRRGFRPDFSAAARPETAVPLYELFVSLCDEATGRAVKTGEFGADMRVFSENDGPVTIVIESSELREPRN